MVDGESPKPEAPGREWQNQRIKKVTKDIQTLSSKIPKDAANELAKNQVNQEVIGELGILADQRNKEVIKTKAQEAAVDTVTGVYSRKWLDTELPRQYALAERLNTTLTLLFVDGDNFGTVNKQFGHQIGDKVLREMAQTLHDTLRATDSIARYGGEEFVALLESQGLSQKELSVLIDRVQKAVGDRVRLPDGRRQTVSIGVATFSSKDPHKVESAQQLLERADAAHHVAKEQGKDRYVEWNPEIPPRISR